MGKLTFFSCCLSGGVVKNNSRAAVLLNKRVVVPRYFWKAICDPLSQRSVVFLAENPTEVEDNTRKNGCDVNSGLSRFQTPSYGIINCYSLKALQQDKHFSQQFNLPSFSDSCKPGVRGKFLDEFLNAALV
jgi:hypothetical protein